MVGALGHNVPRVFTTVFAPARHSRPGRRDRRLQQVTEPAMAFTVRADPCSSSWCSAGWDRSRLLHRLVADGADPDLCRGSIIPWPIS
jgi:hypothetical protein